MVILDTHAIVYDALDPKRPSRRAARAIEGAAGNGTLARQDLYNYQRNSKVFAKTL